MTMDLSTLLKLFSLCYCIVLANADDCVQKSPCSCVFPNGTGIDLTPSTRKTMYISNTLVSETTIYDGLVSVWNRTFYFHPCYDVPMPTELNPLLLNACAGDVSICYHLGIQTIDEKGLFQHTSSHLEYYNFGGSANNTHFALNGTYIEYPLYPTQNVVGSTEVHLVCGESDDTLVILSLASYDGRNNNNKLQFTSRNACLRQIEPPSQAPQVVQVAETVAGVFNNSGNPEHST